MELGGRTGLFNAPALRKEIAVEVPALAALAVGNLGEQGVLLESAKPKEAELQPA
jgi:hypothetical protein